MRHPAHETISKVVVGDVLGVVIALDVTVVVGVVGISQIRPSRPGFVV